jgi:ribonuclease T1
VVGVLILLLGVLAGAYHVALRASGALDAASPRLRAGPPPEAVRETPPRKALDVLAEIERRGGEAPPGHVGGRTFENRERRLPRGHYREYDVSPRVRGRDRGPERIVIEQRTGKAYYTGDHYRTFLPLN